MRMLNRNNQFIIFVMTLGVASGCGLNTAEYEPYEKPEQESTATTAEANAEQNGTEEVSGCAADAVFSQSIAPAIAQTCSTCHGVGGQANSAFALTSGDDEGNAAKLLGFMGGNAETLNVFIGPSGRHGGGDQSGALSPTNVTVWIDTLATCNSEGEEGS